MSPAIWGAWCLLLLLPLLRPSPGCRLQRTTRDGTVARIVAPFGAIAWPMQCDAKACRESVGLKLPSIHSERPLLRISSGSVYAPPLLTPYDEHALVHALVHAFPAQIPKRVPPSCFLHSWCPYFHFRQTLQTQNFRP